MIICKCSGCTKKNQKNNKSFEVNEVVTIPADYGVYQKASGKVDCEFIAYTSDMERGIVKIRSSGVVRETNLHWIKKLKMKAEK